MENISFRAGIGENLRLGIMRKFPKEFPYPEIIKIEQAVQNKTASLKNYTLDVSDFDKLQLKFFKLTNIKTGRVADNYFQYIKESSDITINNIVKIIKDLKEKHNYLSEKEVLEKKHQTNLKKLKNKYPKVN